MIINLLASERSERDTYRGNTIENRGCHFICWRASEASETLSGVTQLKIGDVCLFIYMDVRMSFCTLTLRIFVFAPRSTPSQTSLNRILRFSDHYRIALEIELFTALTCFAGAVKTQKLMAAPFLFELVTVVS